jgi:hypothetical protein
LAIEVEDAEARTTVAAVRDRLIGHFLGCTGSSVTKATVEFGGLGAAIEALNGEGRLRALEPRPLTALGAFIARHHLGDPSNVADSWRPGRRRERLFEEARRIAVDPDVQTGATRTSRP